MGTQTNLRLAGSRPEPITPQPGGVPDIAEMATRLLGFRIVPNPRPGAKGTHLVQLTTGPAAGMGRNASDEEVALWDLLVTPQTEWGS